MRKIPHTFDTGSPIPSMILRWRNIYHRFYKPCDQTRRKSFCVGYLYVMSGLWSALSKTDTNKTSTPITNNMSTWGLLAISLLQYYQTKIKRNMVKYDRRKPILVLSVIWPIPLSSPTDNNTAFKNRKKLLLAILGSHFIWANIEA